MKRALSLCLPLCLMVGLVRADGPDPAEWAPAAAIAFVGVSDVKQLQEAIDRTDSMKMLKDPAVKKLSGQWSLLGDLGEKIKARLAKALDVEAERLRNPFAGPISAFALPGPEAEAPRAVVIAGVGDAALMREYYDKVVARFKAAADTYESTEAGENRIDYFEKTTPTEMEEPEFDPENFDEDAMNRMFDQMLDQAFSPEAMPPKVAMCLTKDRLLVGTGVDELQKALRQEKGDSLAQTEEYRALPQMFKPLGQIRMFVNVAQIVEEANREADEDARKVTQAMGLGSMRTALGHVLYNVDDQIDTRMEGALTMRGDRVGLMKILSMENRDLTPDGKVGADNLMYAALNINPPAVLEEVERITRQVDPDSADEMRRGMEGIELPDGGTLNLRTELVGNLTGPLTFGLGFARPLAADAARMVLSIGHRDKATITRLMDLLISAGGGMFTDRDLNGSRIYDMGMVSMSMAASADRIFMGNTPTVESALRGSEADSLAATAEFRRSARLAPQQGWMLFYMDQRRFLENAIGLVRFQSEMEQAFGNVSAMMGLAMVQQMGLKAEEAEDAKVLLKYAGPSIMTIATTSEGLRLTALTLRPSKE